MFELKIGQHKIGGNNPCFVIAEAGVNHNGSLERAYELIDKAAQAGANAVKFQTYKAETLVTKKAPKFWEWEGDKDRKTQFEAYRALDGFSWSHYPKLIKRCQERGVEFLSTPFDFQAADYLDKIGMPAFKIASSDLTYHQFLRHIARKRKPILLSTGAATLGEVDDAISIIRGEGNSQIVVMHCTLKYPTPYNNANLRVIQTFKKIYPDLVIGLSDHTMGILAPPIATALGAKVVEKHYTVDNALPESADHWLSVNPELLYSMVNDIRLTEELLGFSAKRVFSVEKETYLYDKRSLVSTRLIKKGEKISAHDLTCKRPGTGIRPCFEQVVIGRTAKVDIPEDTTLTWKMV